MKKTAVVAALGECALVVGIMNFHQYENNDD